MKLKDTICEIIDNRGKNPEKIAICGIPIIDNSLIINEPYPDLNNVKRYLGFEYSKKFLRCDSKKDDLLITLVGNGYGNITLCPENCCIIQNTIGLRFKSNISQKYMYYNLLNYRQAIRGLNRGASQPSIKVSDLLDIDVRIHKLKEQQHIVNTISILLLKSL